MRWHLMTLEGETDARPGIPLEDQASGIAAWVLLRPDDYARWKRAEGQGTYPGRVFPLDARRRRWSRRDELPGERLEPAHRLARRLPTAEEVHDPRFPDTLERYEVDRFWRAYGDLPDEAVALFERHLRFDAETERVLVELETLADEGGVDEEDALCAMRAALFHRAPEVLGRWRNRRLDRPEQLPLALPAETRRILRGHTGRAAMRRHADGLEEQVACAALRVARSRAVGHSPPGWAEALLEGEEEL